MSKAIVIQCPSCGGTVNYVIGTEHARCNHCGQELTKGDLKIEIASTRSPAQFNQVTHADSMKTFMQMAPWDESEEERAGVKEYSCPSCAARVLAWQAEITTSCPYCGNELLVSGAARASFIPEFVLPFSITKEEAIERVREHCAPKPYLARNFSPEPKHIQGMYVPYRLYDVFVSGETHCTGKQVVRRGKYSHTNYYAIKKKGRGKLYAIPIDVSSRMPDSHMDAVAPFDLTKLKPFSPEYIAGYIMEVADELKDESAQRAKGLATASFEQYVINQVRIKNKDLEVANPSTIISNARITDEEYCAFPIWLMHYTWHGEDLLFAVNGQTGECVGNLPVDKKKRSRVLVFRSILSNSMWVSPTLGVMIFCIIFVFFPHSSSNTILCLLFLSFLLLMYPLLCSNLIKHVQKLDAKYLASMNSAKKSTNSIDAHAREEIATTPLTCRQCASLTTAFSLTSSHTVHNSFRSIRMACRTANARDQFCRDMSRNGIVVKPLSPKREILKLPFTEELTMAFNSSITSDGKRGFFTTNAGLYCATKWDRLVFMRWKDFATAEKPVLDGNHICVHNTPVAFDLGNPHMRAPLLELYTKLQDEAKSIYLPRKTSSRSVQDEAMVSGVYKACWQHLSNKAMSCFNLTPAAFEQLQLLDAPEPIFVHDDTFNENGVRSFAITSTGIVCKRNEATPPHAITWRHLANLRTPTWDGSCITASKVPLACYTGDDSAVRLLLALMRDIHGLAQLHYLPGAQQPDAQ